jgi:excisionase family DNA binding protein
VTDHILIPINGAWLALSSEAFAAALKAGERLVPAIKPERPAAPLPVNPAAELLDAKSVARALSLPVSWVCEKARQGEIPSARAGRYVRFDLAAVRRALAATDHESIGRR